MNDVLAIDPGPVESGWCYLRDGKPIEFGVLDNGLLLGRVSSVIVDLLAIEMVASYGMAVGKDVFETCVWIGRFQQAWRMPNQVQLIYRKTITTHICGRSKANGSEIRQALIDRFGPVGTKKKPGPTYGITSHAWSALAVAVTAAETGKFNRKRRKATTDEDRELAEDLRMGGDR